MVDKERVTDLAKMLMTLRMASSQAEAEVRALQIIQTTGTGGPTVSAMHEKHEATGAGFNDLPADIREPRSISRVNGTIESARNALDGVAEESVLAVAESAAGGETSIVAPVAEIEPEAPQAAETTASEAVVETAQEETSQNAMTEEGPVTEDAPSSADIQAAPEDENAESDQPAPAADEEEQTPPGVLKSTNKYTVFSPLDEARVALSQLSEDETKEAFNARELEDEMNKLKRELENSRKEVEMLRNKLTRTEEALAKAQQTMAKDDRQLSQPQPRQQMPNHEKPRGQNPVVDLSKIFKR